MEDFEVSALNTKPLVAHTEHFEFTGLPPRYVALWAMDQRGDQAGING